MIRGWLVFSTTAILPLIKAAKGTEYFTLHAKVQTDINSLKTKLRRKLVDKTIDKFHETFCSTEVERQKRRAQSSHYQV